MDSRTPSAASPLYLLERTEVGIIQLDADRFVVGMNDHARRVLPVDEKQPFDRFVLSFHPERSQPKVAFLLDQAGQCPVSAPPPMTMIINIPERVLLIKVSRMRNGRGEPTGYTLVFHDITELVAGEEPPAARSARAQAAPPTPSPDQTPGQSPNHAPNQSPSPSPATAPSTARAGTTASAPVGATAHHRRLLKVPTVSGQSIALVDAQDILCIRSDGHYTRVLTRAGSQFCNLAISDLESRLDPAQFMRVHRSHLVNLGAVRQLQRDDGRLALALDGGPDEPIPVSRSSTAELLRRLGMAPGAAGSGRDMPA